MKYVPHFALAARPTLVVDSSARSPHCTLELSHWPGNKTPSRFKRDTSTEAVLAWLATGTNAVREFEQVTVDHFDIDGLLAAWCALFPDAAMAQADLLAQVATTEDFERFESERCLELTLELLAIERGFARNAAQTGISGSDRWTAYLYERTLPAVETCLERRFTHEAEWHGEFHDVMLSLARLRTGADGTEVLTRPELDLALVRSDQPLHNYAINCAVPASRMLVCVPGRRPQFLYRYESFVEFISRDVLGRAPLQPMASLLNEHERRGIWVAEGMLAAHPRVLLFGPDAGITFSSIAAEALLDIVAGYFLHHAEEGGQLWTPALGLPGDGEAHPELLVRPPWMAADGRRHAGGAA